MNVITAQTRRSAVRLRTVVLFAVLGWFCLTFVYLPNLSILGTVVNADDSVGGLVGRLLDSRRAVNGIRETVIVAALSLATVNVVGVTQVLLLEGLHVRGKRFLTIAYALPIVFGSISAVTGYSLVYGRSGILTDMLQGLYPGLEDDWFKGRWAVVFTHTFTMTGFHFLFLRPAIKRVDFSLVEAARSLGMSPVPALIRVVLPAIRPMMITTTLMVLVMAGSSFAAPHILGGAGFTMVGPLVRTLNDVGRPDLAALLALGLGLMTAALMIPALRSERKFVATTASKVSVPFEPIRLKRMTGRIAAHIVAYVLACINLLPFIVSALMSLSPIEDIRSSRLSTSFTLVHYRRVLSESAILEPLQNSLTLSTIAVTAAVVIGTISAFLIHRRRGFIGDVLQISVFLPYILPGILIAIGFLFAFGSPSALLGGRVLVGSYPILPLAYIVSLLPLIVRLIGAGLAEIDPTLGDAARSLGARPLRVAYLITLPLLAPVILQAAAISFNATFDEYTLSVMLYNVNNRPLGVALGTLAESVDLNLAGITTAYIILSTLVALVVILTADRAAGRAARRSVGR